MYIKLTQTFYKFTTLLDTLIKEILHQWFFNALYNTKLLESWVEHFLIKELKPDQYVVMDNASFHKSQKTGGLIESVGCEIIFLPPYSLDLNPIEKFWTNMKR